MPALPTRPPTAVLAALRDFYANHTDLIAEAFAEAHKFHASHHADRISELDTVTAEITKPGHAIDRLANKARVRVVKSCGSDVPQYEPRGYIEADTDNHATGPRWVGTDRTVGPAGLGPAK